MLAYFELKVTLSGNLFHKLWLGYAQVGCKHSQGTAPALSPGAGSVLNTSACPLPRFYGTV
jgi:hypothetical protein